MVMDVRIKSLHIGIGLSLLAVGAALADHQPVIVLRGNVQVPVIINGVDASGTLVYGDWGLYAPGRVTPQIVGPVSLPIDPHVGPYYPRTGRTPAYGRREVFVPSRPPPPAPTYYREWSAGSRPGPVTTYPPYQMPEVMIEQGERERPVRRPRRRATR
jgi:hypothetical protein